MPGAEPAAAPGTPPAPARGAFSLRSKIVVVLTLVVGAYGIFDSVVRKAIVAPTFRKVEQDQASADVARISIALRREISILHQFALNWAQSDDTCAFTKGTGVDVARRQWSPERLRANRVDLMHLCDSTGAVLWHFLEVPDRPSHGPLRLFPTGRLSDGHPLLGQEKCGLLLTEAGPMLLSSRVVVPSAGDAEPHGTLILGRFLSERLDKELTDQTKVDFDFWQLGHDVDLPPEERAILDDLTAAPPGPYLHETADGQLVAYETFPDIWNRPDFLIRANVPRDVSRTGSTATRYALLSMIGACLIGLLALLGLLQRIVLTPISALTAHAVRIGQEEDFSAKLALERNDEIGILARELDAMMEKLETARRDLMETARHAGMSEIATGILHNVGNVLNSVNISAALIAERAHDLGTSDLAQLARVLEENRADLAGFVSRDPRAQHLPPLVSALAEHVSEQRSTILAELGSLTEGIEHIRELIRSQQDYAGRGELIETVELPELVEQALGITEKALGRDADLVIERRLAATPTLLIDRHKVLEILVNLLQNARQAMDATPAGERRLVVAAEVAPGDRLRLSVTDSGVGIPRENLLRIFSLGFTTKRSGHGFGLHASANAAAALGGTLEAASEGEGRGATFTLVLPMRAARHAEAVA